MQDIFYEESSRTINKKSALTKYKIGNIFMYFSYILAIIWGLANFLYINLDNLLLSIIAFILPIIIFVLIGVLIGKVKNNFYVDYDYTFVSGSIRFSKIIAEVNRKNIIEFENTDIQKIGFLDSQEYLKLTSNSDIKPEFITANSVSEEGKNFYYFYIIKNCERRLFVVDMSKEFLINIAKTYKITIFEKGIFD